MEVQPQMAAPVPEVPAMEVQPQMAAPVPEVPVMEVQPQMAAPVPEVPVMEVQPQMAAPVPEVPVMEVQPQMAAPVPEVPVMEVQPQAAAPVPEVPVMEVQPQAAPVPEDTYHIGNGTNMMSDFDFSIGEDDSVNSDDMGFSSGDDLFEFDTIPAASFISYDDGTAESVPEAEPTPVYEKPAPVAYEESAISPAPVFEEPAADPVPTYNEAAVSMEQPVYQEPSMDAAPVYEEPAIAPAPVYQEPVEQIQPGQIPGADVPVAETGASDETFEAPDMAVAEISAPQDGTAVSMEADDEEAEFLAEMAMGDEEEVAEEESSVSDIATINELESMLTQLRSFESVMKARPEPGVPEAVQETASTDVNITNLDAVSSFLNEANEQPQQEVPVSSTPASSQPARSTAVPTSSNVRYTEVRNRETDDSVNSLVDLLKGDDQPKKRGFFGGRSRKKNIPKEILPDSTTTSYRAEPVPARPTPAPAPAPRQMREVRSPETDDSVDSLVELLKGNDSKKKSKGWGKSSSGADEFRMSSSLSSSTPVPVSPKVAQSKTYTKVSTTQSNATVDVTAPQTSSIPKPSVSEPKVYRPTSGKSFEEKAAAPGARQVETTATITKPLEAKAISTKPSETKSVEAKNVETKAVVTPKPEAKPEPKQESDGMDDFKRRLMQAHLIPDGNGDK
jgi:hypothetical protein